MKPEHVLIILCLIAVILVIPIIILTPQHNEYDNYTSDTYSGKVIYKEMWDKKFIIKDSPSEIKIIYNINERIFYADVLEFRKNTT